MLIKEIPPSINPFLLNEWLSSIEDFYFKLCHGGNQIWLNL